MQLYKTYRSSAVGVDHGAVAQAMDRGRPSAAATSGAVAKQAQMHRNSPQPAVSGAYQSQITKMRNRYIVEQRVLIQVYSTCFHARGVRSVTFLTTVRVQIDPPTSAAPNTEHMFVDYISHRR